jgi:hypothetical protein
MQTNINRTNYMKSLFRSKLSKAALLLVPLALCLAGSTTASAGDRDAFFPEAVRPGNWNDHTELKQGYLKVYSASDEVRDGDTRYFPHTPYIIYTIDGQLFKSVENRRSANDEIPELVSLPVGSYRVIARSVRGGYVRILVVIKEDKETVLDLDLWETAT